MTSERVLRWALFTPILLCFVVLVLLTYNKGNLLGTADSIQVGKLNQVWLALHEYAEDHDGKFPASLLDLEPYFLQGGRQFHDLMTRKPGEWVYYAGHTLRDPPDTILAAFPVPVVTRSWLIFRHDYRVVACVGIHPEIIPEADFQRRIAP